MSRFHKILEKIIYGIISLILLWRLISRENEWPGQNIKAFRLTIISFLLKLAKFVLGPIRDLKNG